LIAWHAEFWRQLATLVRGQSHRIVIFIDADNVPPRVGNALFSYARTIGRIAHAELFANFAAGAMAGWAGQVRQHGIECRHVFRTSGRNATDIALTVAAMDHLHRGTAATYLIVTSDADLAPLAHRMRMQGAQVHGVGSQHAAQAFRQACDRFVALGDLDAAIKERTETCAIPTDLWQRGPEDAEDHILSALVRLGGARDWIEISRLSHELTTSYGRFDSRAFSRRSLTALLEALDSVAVDRTLRPGRVRLALQRSQ
jgi:hypothetical protein